MQHCKDIDKVKTHTYKKTAHSKPAVSAVHCRSSGLGFKPWLGYAVLSLGKSLDSDIGSLHQVEEILYKPANLMVRVTL